MATENKQPGIVRKLDEAVVNRIAAGEVIQRPANAVKEMIENSLDAGATSIQVSVKHGGLKVLQIQDNGTGIRREDLPIVCHRFTTSKLKEFSDLSSIATYGFRGEALASITHVAHVTVTTRTIDDKCAYRASYSDGELKGPPQPCAGTVGTIITVEDLFYNVRTRQEALKNPNEEYGRIADVVSRYAIHNASVAFSLKKIGEAKNDVRTPPKSTVLDNIREIFGTAIARELVAIKVEEVSLKFKLEGYVTNANYSSKKHTFLLFINHRLVDSAAIRKGLEEIYSSYLPRHAYPFIYLSLELPPQNLDVNVHPTKHEVFFLNQDALVERIQQVVDGHLVNHKSSRTFYTQTFLPVGTKPGAKPDAEDDATGGRKAPRKQGSDGVDVDREYQHEVVRADARMQKLDKFFPRVGAEGGVDSGAVRSAEVTFASAKPDRPRIEVDITSILNFRRDVEAAADEACMSLLKEAAFVGCVSQKSIMFQVDTTLYMADLNRLCWELFYQAALYEFQNFGRYQLDPPAPLRKLARASFDVPSSSLRSGDEDKDSLAEFVEEKLVGHARMLGDYFGIKIDENRCLVTVPMLLEKFPPDPCALPEFLTRLVCEVNWKNEKACLQGLCKELATFYSKFTAQKRPKSTGMNAVDDEYAWTVEHVLFPAIKANLAAPGRFLHDRTILPIANTKELYKVFERC